MINYLFAYTLLALLVLSNIYASYRCFASEFSEQKQKLFQFIFIWLIPILGAALVIFMSRPMDTGPDYKTTDAADTVSTHPVSSENFGGDGGGE